MNILFITEDHSLNNYGITTVLSQLADELARRNNNFRVVIAVTGETSVSQHPSVQVELIPPVKWGLAWHWSPNLLKRLDELVVQNQIDIIHVHGVWTAGLWAGLRVARRRKIPSIVSVHGMWEPWFWQADSPLRILKKKIYFTRVIKPAISPDTIMHAITPMEKENILHLLPKNKIVLIPNAIQVERLGTVKNELNKMILFLGRLHPKKGVEILLKAFSLAKLGVEWRLIIAGPEEVPEYTKMLKNEAIRLALSQQVEFIGPVFGNEKWDFIRQAWVMAVPSLSEVVGMVNLEAAACGVPSITTFSTGLWDWQEGGGLLVTPDVEAFAKGLKLACGWNLEERYERGNQSYHLIVEKYSWDAVSSQWAKFYNSLRPRGV